MKQLRNFLKQPGALSRLAEATGRNVGSLHKWASGEWTPSAEAREQVLSAMKTVRVFRKKPGPTKKSSCVARREHQRLTKNRLACKRNILPAAK